ncbi:MAG TPA: hypothetical protein PK014_08445 [Thermoanaerobaculia bacterium]|nr:hypothetical protein [Thermoanaerobaculia bacterium]HUM30142.1 hypothetical protein [Thermoanaerobaculia bacterium]HXK68408.1 hypothetical protein [Thermoanaerobaculia bacterium]
MIPLEENHLDAYKITWLSYIISDNLRKHEEHKINRDKSEPLNKSSSAIFSAGIAIIIALYRDLGILALSWTLLIYVVCFFAMYKITPIIISILSERIKKYFPLTYRRKKDLAEAIQVKDDMTIHTTNRLYLAKSLLLNINKCNIVKYDLIKFYDVIDIMEEVLDIIRNYINNYISYGDEHGFRKGRIIAVINVCKDIINDINDINDIVNKNNNYSKGDVENLKKLLLSIEVEIDHIPRPVKFMK